MLLTGAVLALLVANSPFAASYTVLLQYQIGPMPMIHWINDGLMTLFFFLVGLEIKRELVDGHLSSWEARTLPAIAALGGMAVPALVYLSIAGSDPVLVNGWAVSSATDIAFAIGIMALLGRRVPASLKLFITTVAIVDDMGAVLIIALAYTPGINGLAILVSAILLTVMLLINRKGVTALWPYLALFLGLWLAILLSGIHATIAGVLAASLVPIRERHGRLGSGVSPLYALERMLHPWVAFLIVPVFGFANAGVSLTGVGSDSLLSALPVGIAAGLFLGKQTGVLATVWLCARLGIASRPANATWLQVYGTALLCGIGFTMSLFIGSLAFSDPLHVDEVKIGVLVGSILSGLAGFLVLRLASQPRLGVH